MQSGILFNVQRFSLHDGPGIRTNLFFKGCPLRCAWCHNPEGLSGLPEISLTQARCIGCGACVQACPAKAHRFEGGTHHIDRSACARCGACAAACYPGALELLGKRYTVAEAVEAVLRDEPFYGTDGGATLTGGEPMAQPDFALAVASALRDKGIGVCVETCGHCPPEALDAIAPYVDRFLYDIKETDDALHRRYTGVPRGRIVENLRRLDAQGATIVLRCPMIPGVNLRDTHIDGIAALANGLRGVVGIDLEPYHPLGASKRPRIGQDEGFEAGGMLDASRLEPFAQALRAQVRVPVSIS